MEYAPTTKKKLDAEKLKRDLLCQQLNNELTGANLVDITKYVSSSGGIMRSRVQKDIRDDKIVHEFSAGVHINDMARTHKLQPRTVANVISRRGVKKQCIIMINGALQRRKGNGVDSL